MSYSPLFVTNTARSGSYLISMMLSANPELMVASEPFLELFRSLRNALVRTGAPAEELQSFDPNSPMQDYYFTDERLRMLEAIQQGDMNTPFDPSEWDTFVERSAPRAALQCAELVPGLQELRGENYKEIFDNAFDLIARVRQSQDRKWVGIKDAWIIEFFGPLAKAYPDAKFIVILRDPRAMVNSMLGVVNEDPTQVAHVLSYARHWRKYIAFLTYYQSLSMFQNRLYFVTHEQVLADPEQKSRDLCEFLDVEFDPAMLDTEQFHDFATGGTWNGNSSFESKTQGISMHRAQRWKSKLDPVITKTVDLVCGPDMKLAGFQPIYEMDGHDPDVLSYLIESDCEYANWKSDLGDIQQDYGFELFRHALLACGDQAATLPLIRRSFLFEATYQALREQKRCRVAA